MSHFHFLTLLEQMVHSLYSNKFQYYLFYSLSLLYWL